MIDKTEPKTIREYIDGMPPPEYGKKAKFCRMFGGIKQGILNRMLDTHFVVNYDGVEKIMHRTQWSRKCD